MLWRALSFSYEEITWVFLEFTGVNERYIGVSQLHGGYACTYVVHKAWYATPSSKGGSSLGLSYRFEQLALQAHLYVPNGAQAVDFTIGQLNGIVVF
jgi:hypothetical protein